MTDTPTSTPSAPAAPAPVDPAPIAPATPAAAREQINRLTDNKEWSARWLAGGIAEHKEYRRLSALADTADEVSEAIAGAAPEAPLIQTLSPGDLSARNLASLVDSLRSNGLDDSSIQQAIRGGEVSEVSRAEYMSARALKSARLGDPEWTKKWLAGQWLEGREMLLINTVITSYKGE